MNNEAQDEIGVGSFVCMKEDVTTASYDEMDDERCRGKKWKMTMRQSAMKKGYTEELDLPLHKHSC